MSRRKANGGFVCLGVGGAGGIGGVSGLDGGEGGSLLAGAVLGMMRLVCRCWGQCLWMVPSDKSCPVCWCLVLTWQ